MLPFGLELKSVLVGIILAMFVWPFVMQTLGRLTASKTPAKKA